MTVRARVLHLVIQPVCVLDDGDSLTPGPELGAFTVALADLDAFPARFRDSFEAARGQIEQTYATADPAPEPMA